MPTIPKEGGNTFDEFPHLIFYTLKEWHRSHRPPPGKGASMDLLHSAPSALAPLATTAGATKRPAGAPPSVFPSTKKPLIATTQEPPSAFVPIPRHGGMTAPSTAPVAPPGGPPTVEAVGATIPRRQQLPVDSLVFASPQFGGGKVPGVATTPVLAGGGAGLLTPELGVKPREGALVQQRAGGELLSATFAGSKDPGEGSGSREKNVDVVPARSEKVAAASAVLKAQRDAQTQSQRPVESRREDASAEEIQKVDRLCDKLSRFRSNRPSDVFKSGVEITYTKEVVKTPFKDPIFKQPKYTVLDDGRTASDRVQNDITFPAKVEGETVPEFIEIGYLDVVAPASVDLTDEEVQKDGTYLSLVTEGRNIYPYFYKPGFGAANEATLYRNSGVYYTHVPGNIWLLQWDKSKEVYVQGRQIRLNGPTLAGPFMPQAALKRVLLPLALRSLVIGLLPQFLPDKGRDLAISFGKPFNFLENLATVCGEAAITSDIGERVLPLHITMHQAAICGKKVQEAVIMLVSRPLSTSLKVLGAAVTKAGSIGALEFGDAVAQFCRPLGRWAKWIVEEIANPEWAVASRVQVVDDLHIDVGLVEYRPAAGTPHPGTPHDRKNLPHRAELFEAIKKAIAEDIIVLSPEDPTGIYLAVCSIANGYYWPDTLLELQVKKFSSLKEHQALKSLEGLENLLKLKKRCMDKLNQGRPGTAVLQLRGLPSPVIGVDRGINQEIQRRIRELLQPRDTPRPTRNLRDLLLAAPQVPQFGDGIAYSGKSDGGESAQGTGGREDAAQEMELEKGVGEEVVENVFMEERGGLFAEAAEQPPYPVDDSLVS